MLSGGLLGHLLCGAGRVGRRLIGHVNGFHVPNLSSQCCPWVSEGVTRIYLFYCGAVTFVVWRDGSTSPKKLIQSSPAVFSCLSHVGKSRES